MNNYKLDKSVIMVTGASGQLGKSIVSNALNSGACVVCCDISIDALQKLYNGDSSNSQVLLIQTDITDKKSVKSAFDIAIDKFGKIDGLINNAGLSIFDPWFERDESDFDSVVDVNLKGTFFCMKEFFKYLIKSKNMGSVVNVASHYGIISPDPRIYTDCNRRNSEIYGATKAGVIQMTKYFAVNAREDGANVRVNAVAPGGILNEDNPQGHDFQKLYSERCPMQRMAYVNEMSGPILFLLSSDAAYINGHTIVVDGGMSVW